ncbi:MAG: hypothetical protein K2O94_02420 [Clostridiales bacterium]|nr:hypothetical protein [Clostridiales bacterium]
MLCFSSHHFDRSAERAKRRNQGVSRMGDNAVFFCGGSLGLLGKLGMMGI